MCLNWQRATSPAKDSREQSMEVNEMIHGDASTIWMQRLTRTGLPVSDQKGIRGEMG